MELCWSVPNAQLSLKSLLNIQFSEVWQGQRPSNIKEVLTIYYIIINPNAMYQNISNIKEVLTVYYKTVNSNTIY